VGDQLTMIRGAYRNLNVHKMTTVMEKDYGTAQASLLQKAALKERCILVDKLDRPVGEATKQVCHEIGTEGCVPLHRAFSVFLFNNEGELLLQKRSSTKVLFILKYNFEYFSHIRQN